MIQKYLVLLCAVVCDGLLMPRSLVSTQPVPQWTPPNCANQVYWNLCNGTKRRDYINTLQRGPGVEGREFRVREIAVVNDIALDLVVTVPTSERYAYTRKKNNNNFMHVSPEPTHPHYENQPGPPCWIVIPWKTQTSTKFHWKFVLTGTNNPPPQELVSFTVGIVELDQEKTDDQEYVTFDTPYTTLLHQGTSISGPTMPTFGLATFRSLTTGVLADNPSFSGPKRSACTPTVENPYGCIDDMQEGRTVHVEYENITEWEMTIGHESQTGRQGDRFLEIYGTVCSVPPLQCPPNKYWDLCRKVTDPSTKWSSSIMPGLGGRQGNFRIKEIATVDGVTIDLVLTIPMSERYSLAKIGGHWRNWPHVSPESDRSRVAEKFHAEATPPAPCWIVIPFKATTATRWNWQFMVTGTNTPKELVRFTLGVVEMDQQTTSDHEFVKFDTAYTELLFSGTGLSQTVDEDERVKFSSTEVGYASDNPSVEGPLAGCTINPEAPYNCLTEQHKRRSVQVQFENKDNFDLSIGHEGGAQADRFLEFYGTTC